MAAAPTAPSTHPNLALTRPLRRRLLAWLKSWLAPKPAPNPERQRALDLIAAIDAGGLPLHPARVNHIARGLGLDVSTRAQVDDTVLRIRAALQR